MHRTPGWVVPARRTPSRNAWGRGWAETGGEGGRGSPDGGVRTREPSPRGRAGGHYLLRRAPLRRRRAHPGTGLHGAGSGSRAAGRVPRAPQPNRGSLWPGRSRWSVAWSVPRRGPGPEPPGLPGPSLAPRSPPPAPYRPRRRHLAPRPPQAPGTPPQGTPGTAARSAPDQKPRLPWDQGVSRTQGPGQAAAGGGAEGMEFPDCSLRGLRLCRHSALSGGSSAILSPRPLRRLG